MYKKSSNIQFINLKQFVLNCLNNLKGQEITCLDIQRKSSIIDLMIICTGQSNRHVISIAQDMYYQLRIIGVRCSKGEGLEYGEWILIDLGEIIIHVMQQKTRKLYSLEKLWG